MKTLQDFDVLQELRKQLQEIKDKKHDAVKRQDFFEACVLRDKEKDIMGMIEILENGDTSKNT